MVDRILDDHPGARVEEHDGVDEEGARLDHRGVDLDGLQDARPTDSPTEFGDGRGGRDAEAQGAADVPVEGHRKMGHQDLLVVETLGERPVRADHDAVDQHGESARHRRHRHHLHGSEIGLLGVEDAWTQALEDGRLAPKPETRGQCESEQYRYDDSRCSHQARQPARCAAEHQDCQCNVHAGQQLGPANGSPARNDPDRRENGARDAAQILRADRPAPHESSAPAHCPGRGGSPVES